ncbi:NADPH-dependent assimilatory sulfite reductase hemoprotein subunit [Prochlorococcus sp. MIT 1223]|uniref:NADPH-dependent assimilatory sulfite reductase hemoprotein subunit n=1 Tax=Prochlorococcus sp. MIT 1223 TaxID=3096217 RepID=UPI002A76129E|nr:NADPH-dependent assimilatory sulfite reductase hemoprotein subunit [Prochlorococcus sp. MIT 1223]
MTEEAHRSIKKESKRDVPCIANGAEKIKFEDFKAESKYLEHPLLKELKNDADHFTNDAVQLLKFHGSYQQDNRETKGKDWQLMLRLRSPGGKIHPDLFVALDNLSNELGNGTLRATTRQAFQMHGIRKENLKEVIGTIIKSMGSTLAACGDINRNVMAPAAPFENGSYPAVRSLANDIADLLSPVTAEGTYLDLWVDGDLSYMIKPSKDVQKARGRQRINGLFSGDKNEPLYGKTYLPRKFKCAVTAPGDNSVDLLTHDIGLVVFTKANGKLKGCNVYVGGGMGRTHNLDETFARIADPLGYVKGEDIFDLVQAILALQRDYGNRKTRRLARMKYVLNDMGLEWFVNELKTKYFSKPIEPLKLEPKMKLEDYLGWHQQSKGLWFVGLPLLSGRLSGAIKDGLRAIVDRYKLEIRLTPNQDILLCNIGSHQKASVKNQLTQIGFGTPSDPNPLQRHGLACPALPLCGLALTEAERTFPEILNRIYLQLQALSISKPILIRMTGCPNGCARPYMAELALVGSGKDQYQLWLGGSRNLQRLAKPFIQRVHIDNLEKVLEPLFLSWKTRSRYISFGDHIDNLDDQAIKDLLSPEQTP